jgi:hypothetical protein
VRVYHGALDAKEIMRLVDAGERDAPGVPPPPKKTQPRPARRPTDKPSPTFDPRAPIAPLPKDDSGFGVQPDDEAR